MASTTASVVSSSLLALALAGCASAIPATGGIGFALPVAASAGEAPGATPVPTATTAVDAAAPVAATTPTDQPVPGAGGGGRGGGSSGPAATPEPQDVITLAGAEEAGFADGPGASARFDFPRALALAPDGSLYVADRLNHRIRKVLADGTTSTYAGTGEAGFQDGPAGQARFDEPSGVALAADGTLYVSDAWNHRVRAIAPDGTVTTRAGTSVPGDADGPGPQAGFDHPGAMAIGSDGALYVADEFAHTVRRVAPDGTVTTLAGDGYSKGHLDGTGTNARLTFPVGLTAGADGTLYVAERDACYLRAVSPTGAVTTLNPQSNYRCGFANGPLAAAAINNALGLGTGTGGALLIADTLNGMVRRADLAQTSQDVSTVVGSEPGYHDGAHALARFLGPVAVVQAPDGPLYVADGHAIRKVLR